MSVKPSIYEEINIQSSLDPSKVVDLRLGAASVDIYESVLVPTLTARILVMDSGGSVQGGNDKYASTIYQGLPVRKLDLVTLDIRKNSPTNENIQLGMFVRGSSNIDISDKKEMFTLELTSAAGINNQKRKLVKYYSPDATYDDHVKTILEQELGIRIPTTSIIEKTTNSGGFYGNKESPFTVINRLAKRSISSAQTKIGGSAGYFFYETRLGLQFRSIDSLVSQQPKAKFVYSEVNHSQYGFKPTPDMPSLDLKIMSYKILKNQDIIEDLARGTLASSRSYFDPYTQRVTTFDEGKFDSNSYSKSMPTLGLEKFNSQSSSAFSGDERSLDVPSRFFDGVMARGTFSKDVSVDFDRDYLAEEAPSNTRYNSLMDQQVEMTVPLNTSVYAGDVVSISIPENKSAPRRRAEQIQVSGNYLVFRLNHHYDPTGSFTKMTLVRDTHGVSRSSSSNTFGGGTLSN